MKLTTVDHIAVAVSNIKEALSWYRSQFEVQTLYEDATWAMLRFSNVKLALVLPGEHPPHVAITRSIAQVHGTLRRHRDGTASVYVNDPFGNVIELLVSDGQHRVRPDQSGLATGKTTFSHDAGHPE